MARGSKFMRSSRRRDRSEDKGLDESDEDYMVGDDDCDESDEDYSSFDGDESEKNLGECGEEEEEEEEVENKVRKNVGRPKIRRGFPLRKRNGVKKPRKKKRVSYKEEDDDDEDEDFTPDYKDESPVTNKNKEVNKPLTRKRGFVKGLKRKRNSNVWKKPVRKNPRLRRKASSGNYAKFDKNQVLEQNSNYGRKRKKLMADSDSDFVCSGSSDYEHTISEEEREQVREASEFCRSMTPSLRNSTSLKRLQEEEEAMYPQRKHPGRKGKEKLEDLKNQMGNQVCGICLSEEGKETVRGTLNSCSHYFCYACIMEWSKVESRCPLCKQRFVTISKPAKSNTGFDLRTVVIQVPERNQVYQPSEEELGGYIDPYENVICIECHQDGDDAFMLLCDLCDSPAHTYCVGLGRQVPEGNWYCEGCRPTAISSSYSQGPSHTPGQRMSINLSGGSTPINNFELNEMYVPDTPLTQGTGPSPSPRGSVGDSQAASPSSRSGAFTVSERRRIQRQIHHLINSRMRQFSDRTNVISATNLENALLGSPINRSRELTHQHTMTPESVASHYTSFEGRLQSNTTSLLHNRNVFSSGLDHSRGQIIQNPASTSVNGSVSGMLQSEPAGITLGINSRSGYEQLRPCSSRLGTGADETMSPYAVRHFNVDKGQVQSVVKSQLKSLSGDMEIGYATFKDIARSSTHTILAGCGLEHRRSEVYPVDPPPVCDHIERMAGEQTSLNKSVCLSCLNFYARNVVRKIMNSRVHHRDSAK